MQSGKKKIRLFFIFIYLLVLAGLLSACETSGSLFNRVTIKSVSSEALIMSDGNAQLTEIYQLTAPRESWELNLELPVLRGNELGLISIGIAAKDVNPVPIYTQFEKETEGKLRNSPAAYEEQILEDKSRIKLFTRFGRGDWLLKIQWSISDAVVENSGQAILDIPLLSLAENIIPDSFQASIILPQRITLSGAAIVMQSSAQISLEQENNIVKLKSSDLEAKDSLNLFLHTSSEVFTALKKDPINLSVSEQLHEAGQKAKSLLASRERIEFVKTSIPYILVASLLLLSVFYFYYELEGLRQPIKENFALWPTSVKAYNCSMLLNKDNPERIILCSLISLLNQKELWLDDYVFTWPHSGRVDFSKLRPSETYILHWFFQDLASSGPALSAAQIKRAAQDPASKNNFKINFQEFLALINTEHQELGLIDQGKTKFSRILTTIFSLFFALLAISLTIFAQNLSGLLLLISAFGFLLLRTTTRHLTKEGRARMRECREYAKHLDDLLLLTSATGAEYSLIETAILALPRAVALDRVDLFFDGLETLTADDFTSCAYALLHIYLRVPLPENINSPSLNKDELQARLNDLRDILLKSEGILTAGLHGFDKH